MIRTKTIILAIVVLFSQAAFILWQRAKIDTLRTERNQVIEFAKPDSLTWYKNKLGRETARAKVLDLSVRNLRELRDTDHLSFVGQFTGLNKRLNNLEAATQTTAQVVREWQLPLRDTFLLNVDSTMLSAKYFSYSDSLNSISGTIIGSTIRPLIEITVPLQGVMYWQRKKFLGLRIGRKQWHSDITSTNPYAKITKHEFIKILKR